MPPNRHITLNEPSGEPSFPTGLPAAPLAVVSETDLQAACRATWAAYASAYRDRHGVAPVRNAKVNSNVRQIVQRLGHGEAPLVAAWFLTVNERYVVQNMHDLGALLAKCEAYRTQWATGVRSPKRPRGRPTRRRPTSAPPTRPRLCWHSGGRHMLGNQEQDRLVDLLVATAEVIGDQLSPNAAAYMVSDLAQYPLPMLERALASCRRELKARLSLAAILERIEDGHPAPNEAWANAIRAADEGATVVWTEQTRDAWAAALRRRRCTPGW